MQIVVPIAVTDANLVSSSVPEDDAPVWSAATTYADEDEVIFEHAVYESLVDGNIGNQPDTSPDKWLRLGATNRFKAFDEKISDLVVLNAPIEYVVAHDGSAVTSVSAFGLQASAIRVVSEDPGEGVVFDQTFTLIDNDQVIDWFSYFFGPVGEQRREIIINNIPPFALGETTVQILGGGELKVGQIVLGRATPIGVARYGTNVGIRDFSRKDRDDFGNPIIVERGFARLVDFDLVINTTDTRRIQNLLAQNRARPVVWNGSVDDALGTLVYGYYLDFEIVLSSPSVSNVSIQVEGLV